MKKLVAALLVLTMVLALTGTVAMADCKFKVGTWVKFTNNAVCYKNPHSGITSTTIRKGSQSFIIDTRGSDWVKIQLHPIDVTIDGVSWEEDFDGIKAGWFKVSDLKVLNNPQPKVRNIAGVTIQQGVYIVYSNGGVKQSLPMPEDTTVDTSVVHAKYCHVKATAKVYMHRVHALTKNYGRALHKDEVVKYRHLIGFDSRVTPFYGIRYNGKNLWVSYEYSKLVK